MADETTTTSTAQENLGTASAGQTQPPTNAGTTPDKATALEKEVQRLRSEMGRQLAEERRQRTAAEQAAINATMSTMDETQRALYRAELAERRAQAAEAREADNSALTQRFQRISDLSQKTGVPLEELDQAQSPDDMAVIVSNYLSKKQSSAVEARAEVLAKETRDNAVDLGGGGGKRKSSTMDDQIKAARASGDVRELAKLMFAKKE